MTTPDYLMFFLFVSLCGAPWILFGIICGFLTYRIDKWTKLKRRDK